jgi:hypothetical protein
MIGSASIRDALKATAGSAEILERVAQQMVRVFEVEPTPLQPTGWRLLPDEQAIAAVEEDDVRLITAADLARLPEPELRRLFVIERSLQNHYEAWLRVLPKLEPPCEPSVAVQCRHLLREIAVDMVPDVEALCHTLQHAGVTEQDRFDRVSQLIRSVGEGHTPAPWAMP